MSASTTATLQRPNGADVADPQDGQGVSSRRLKKREIDRRCQRQARERTKTRIAYLEGLVEDFRRQDSSGQVATLMKQLQEIEAERDLMSRTLKDIQKAMDVHKPTKPDQEPPRQDSSSHINSAQVIWASNDIEERKPSIASLCETAPAHLNDQLPEPSQPIDFELATFSPSPSVVLPAQEILFGPQVVRLDSDSPQSTSQALVQSKAFHDPTLMPSSYAKNWDQPLNGCSCQNHHDDFIMPGKKSIWRGNYWRYANEVLSERFDWPEEVEPTSDAVADDVPVRAVLEGWDAVARRGPLHPSWQILRRIDQILFRSCGQTERLAILRAMHSLLQFHTESTSYRYSRLPPWYNKRPAQKIAHSYAIDYFAWPGLRERFIFGEHDYCGNEFWHLFNKSLRVLWPYEFRDCYTREIETGLYKVSPHFDERLRDIKSWTMGPDIFQRFPELYCDIPSFNTIPANITSTSPRASSFLLTAPPSSIEKQKIPPAEEKKPHRSEVQRQQHGNHTSHSGVNSQMPGQHMPLFSSTAQYIIPEHNSMTALDAFAYGAISEADFAAMYHPEDLEGYPNIIF
ncbi:uncharacterized protein A1O9_06758 [Exophiala aquamarina CBS 119918]|uniref:BZIP domain-containing protein n=1 Tax=Exophiala aquamarina CBS 119918 TaxID=1182545 RepID=A0A072PM02_9EURO|nr:uncharacterized protein A1O9_06758 [Exophiala aquamarina CBS 119918]KEF56570.1 hypothetical protein A1O9_06758 [Exophiala aquamarina CBS 119918]